MQLAAFAGTLKQGQVCAVNVASDERDSEGTFWLCNLLGDAYQLQEAMTCMGENYEAGFWVVRVQWYEFCGETNLGERKYKLSAGERTLGANAIKRIDPIELAKTDPRDRNRGRSGRAAANAYVLSESEEHRIEHSS